MQLTVSQRQARNSSNIISRSARGILNNTHVRSEANPGNLGMSTSSVGSSKSRNASFNTVNSQNMIRKSEIVEAKTIKKASKFVKKNNR